MSTLEYDEAYAYILQQYFSSNSYSAPNNFYASCNKFAQLAQLRTTSPLQQQQHPSILPKKSQFPSQNQLVTFQFNAFERDTWLFIDTLYSDPLFQGIEKGFVQNPQFLPYTKENDILYGSASLNQTSTSLPSCFFTLIHSDPTFRQALLLLQWLETIKKQSTFSWTTDCQLWVQHFKNAPPLSLTSPETWRESSVHIDKFFDFCFLLLRSGQFQLLQNLARDCGLPWFAALIQGPMFYSEMYVIDEESTFPTKQSQNDIYSRVSEHQTILATTINKILPSMPGSFGESITMNTQYYSQNVKYRAQVGSFSKKSKPLFKATGNPQGDSGVLLWQKSVSAMLFAPQYPESFKRCLACFIGPRSVYSENQFFKAQPMKKGVSDAHKGGSKITTPDFSSENPYDKLWAKLILFIQARCAHFIETSPILTHTKQNGTGLSPSSDAQVLLELSQTRWQGLLEQFIVTSTVCNNLDQLFFLIHSMLIQKKTSKLILRILVPLYLSSAGLSKSSSQIWSPQVESLISNNATISRFVFHLILYLWNGKFVHINQLKETPPYPLESGFLRGSISKLFTQQPEFLIIDAHLITWLLLTWMKHLKFHKLHHLSPIYSCQFPHPLDASKILASLVAIMDKPLVVLKTMLSYDLPVGTVAGLLLLNQSSLMVNSPFPKPIISNKEFTNSISILLKQLDSSFSGLSMSQTALMNTKTIVTLYSEGFVFPAIENLHLQPGSISQQLINAVKISVSNPACVPMTLKGINSFCRKYLSNRHFPIGLLLAQAPDTLLNSLNNHWEKQRINLCACIKRFKQVAIEIFCGLSLDTEEDVQKESPLITLLDHVSAILHIFEKRKSEFQQKLLLESNQLREFNSFQLYNDAYESLVDWWFSTPMSQVVNDDDVDHKKLPKQHISVYNFCGMFDPKALPLSSAEVEAAEVACKDITNVLLFDGGFLTDFSTITIDWKDSLIEAKPMNLAQALQQFQCNKLESNFADYLISYRPNLSSELKKLVYFTLGKSLSDPQKQLVEGYDKHLDLENLLCGVVHYDWPALCGFPSLQSLKSCTTPIDYIRLQTPQEATLLDHSLFDVFDSNRSEQLDKLIKLCLPSLVFYLFTLFFRLNNMQAFAQLVELLTHPDSNILGSFSHQQLELFCKCYQTGWMANTSIVLDEDPGPLSFQKKPKI